MVINQWFMLHVFMVLYYIIYLTQISLGDISSFSSSSSIATAPRGSLKDSTHMVSVDLSINCHHSPVRSWQSKICCEDHGSLCIMQSAMCNIRIYYMSFKTNC